MYGAIFFIILGFELFAVGYYFGTVEVIEETVFLLVIGPFFVIFGIFLAIIYVAPEKFEGLRQKISSEKDPESVKKNRHIIIIAVILIVIIIIIILIAVSFLGDFNGLFDWD